VWANAGSSIPTLFLDTKMQTLRDQMDINYWAATYLAHSTLRAWLLPNSKPQNRPDLPKHFVMTSSSSCFVGVTGYNPYSPPKAAMRNLADGLSNEIQIYNGSRERSTKPTHSEVKIHCVFPGSILSPGFAEENKLKHPVTKILEDGDPHQSIDEVAAVSVRELENGHFFIATNWLGKLMRWSALSGSPRNGWGLLDTVVPLLTPWVWLFQRPYMDWTAYKWGKDNGIEVKPL
jgi:3-dehydrosphinganine reductase